MQFLLAIFKKYDINMFIRCGRSSGVERNLAKVDVEGSNPFTRSIKRPPFKVVFLISNLVFYKKNSYLFIMNWEGIMRDFLSVLLVFVCALLGAAVFFSFLGTALYLGLIFSVFLFCAVAVFFLWNKILLWWNKKHNKTADNTIYIDGVEYKLPNKDD